MNTSIDLLRRAVIGTTEAALARELRIAPSTISMAKQRGRLSPTLAGQLAQRIGENPAVWIAAAALEAEPATTARDKLRRVVEKVGVQIV